MRSLPLPARTSVLAGLALLFVLNGCDSGPPKGVYAVQPVEGQVLFEGKPVSGAQVSLHPVDESKFGDSVPRPTGQTDENGKFKLMTYASGDGAPEGDYLVGVLGQARPQSEAGNLLDGAKNAANPDVLQGRFANPKTSGLKVTIKAGPNNLEPFQLDGKSGGAAAATPDRGR